MAPTFEPGSGRSGPALGAAPRPVPRAAGRGIGTLLLDELVRRRPGRRVFLFTDSGCTYQFYERRGFTRAATRNVRLSLPGGGLALECMVYVRTL